MFFRKSKLIRLLTQEIQRLRELLARTEGERDSFREMAREAIGLAKEKHFPEPYQHDRGGFMTYSHSQPIRPNRPPPANEYEFSYTERVQAKNCPECSVSVRSESWPMECPACHCVFGFNESD